MRSLCTIIALLLLNLAAGARGFDLLDPGLDWRSPNRSAQVVFKQEKMTLSSPHVSPGIYNRRRFDLSAKEHGLIEIKMKTSRDGTGELSWRGPGQNFSPHRSLAFFLGSPNKYHTYYLNIKPYLNNAGIDQFLFFPFSGAGSAELTSFRLIKGNFRQKAAAAWQEFWGPAGRSERGKNPFIIFSPRLFGRSIFFYCNWLIFFALIVSLATKQPRRAIALVLGLWLLLEASALVNNWIFFQKDLPFWGRTLEQKRSLQNSADFYAFMKFAEQKVPPQAGFNIITGPQHPYSRERSAYYLYPRKLKYPADYLLLFDAKADKKALQGYKLTGKFRQGAYIYKCISNY